MGVNLFIPINRSDATPAKIDVLVDAANQWGSQLDAFDWCDAFKGEGGAVLTLEQALAFEPGAAPWFVMTVDSPAEFFKVASEPNLPDTWALHETEWYWCAAEAKPAGDDNQSGPANWQALLREAGCDSVLFCKARN